jgi:ABC-type multidrug transport system ATPase subunit
LIQAQDLIKVYKNGHKAVDSNTFCVKKGEVLGLLGPNGAGKSSTFNIMTLAMKRSGGNCKIHSEYIDNINIK